MSGLTTKALGLAIVTALWAVISHLGKLPLQLWPVVAGIACFVGAGSGGIGGLQKSILGAVSGVVWALLYVAVSNALGKQPILDALVLGAAFFGLIYQARIPVLSYTVGAVIGLATAMGARAVTLNGGIRIVVSLAIGCVLGIAAERLAEMLGKMRVVPAMSNR
ncbi:MAG TPA: DUF1097 domain-containing protein [Gemmatimonadales bacterium]|nr:DUF1097 domain-containing protein [Gemmatimonadales bacterium]